MTEKLESKPKVNIFAKAKTVKSEENPKPKKENGKREVDMGSALDVSAAIGILTDTLGSIKETLDVEIKGRMAEEFVKEAIKTQKKPESFKGVSKEASASCEFRKRSTKSVLRPEEVEILKEHGIKTETKVIKEAIPERYFFNPKAFEDPKLVEEISSRLENLTTSEGESLIMLQEGREAEAAEIVDDITMDEVCRKITDPRILMKIFEIISVNALGKFKLNDPSLENIFSILVGAGIKLS